MKKSQVSVEFVIIFFFVMLVMALFLSITMNQVSEISKQRDLRMSMDLAEAIKREIILASQVQDNYMRHFELPSKLNGRNYSIRLLREGPDLMSINISFTERGDTGRYETYLPMVVKGSFANVLKEDSLKHCITKSSDDGIRISMNQISIEYAEIESPISSGIMVPVDLKDSTLFDSQGRLKLHNGQLFSVYVRLSCVDSISYLRTVISVNNSILFSTPLPATLGYAKLEAIQVLYREADSNPVQYNDILPKFGIVPTYSDEPNPFFTAIGLVLGLKQMSISNRNCPNPTSNCYYTADSYDGSITPPNYNYGRYTFQITTPGTCDLGSGNVLKLTYQVQPSATDSFKIEFDPFFNNNQYPNAEIIECGGSSPKALETTRVGAEFAIV